MRRNRIVVPALLAGFSVLFAAGSRAQAPAADGSPATCFEIIAPQRHAEPASPILFDRCSGKTWLLVRAEGRHRSGYRWVALAVDGAHGGAMAEPAAAPNPDGRKCFVFSGRRYCE